VIDPGTIEQEQVGLRHYLEVLRRRKWIVLGVLTVAVAAAAAVSYLQEPVYRAETKLVAGQRGGLIDPRFSGSFAQQLTATMRDLLRSNLVASTVIERLELEETPDELLERVTVSINPETAVLTVSVEDPDPDRAVEIAEEVGDVFSSLVRQRFATQPGPEGEPGPELTVTVFDPAHADPDPVSPKPIRNVALAAFLGLALGLIGGFLREHFDRALRTREAVERAFGVPVIGQIPFARVRGRDQRRVAWESFGEIAEAYRALRANLQYLGVKRPLRTILVTSAAPEQGKTTVAANLAVAIARSGASTAVIEADLRRPRLAEALGTPAAGGGLTSVLVGAAEPASVALEVEPPVDLGPSLGGRLALLPSGPLPPNPSELLSSFQMRDLLEQLGREHEYVVIDSPPLLLVSDALELARMVDGVVLVARRNRASTDEAREIRALVERLDVHLLGVVFTDAEAVGSYGTYGEPQPALPEDVYVLEDDGDGAAPRRTEEPPAEPVSAEPAPRRAGPEEI